VQQQNKTVKQAVTRLDQQTKPINWPVSGKSTEKHPKGAYYSTELPDKTKNMQTFQKMHKQCLMII